MVKKYIKPAQTEAQLLTDTLCQTMLVVSTTPADSSPVLAPERDDTEWEEF